MINIIQRLGRRSAQSQEIHGLMKLIIIKRLIAIGSFVPFCTVLGAVFVEALRVGRVYLLAMTRGTLGLRFDSVLPLRWQ